MDETGFLLKDANVAIIGLGLMGGSLALSLKGHCRKLSALDIHIPTLDIARSKKIVDYIDSDPNKVLSDADLIILACPVPAIVAWLEHLPDYIHHPSIVLDFGSTKRTIIEAMNALPENFDAVGGHPICGKESLSIRYADRMLFQDAPFAFVSLHRTSDNAREAVGQIVEIIGAKPVWIDAETHDQILAITSHLPFLLSASLSLISPDEAAALVGPGFRSSTRLAGTSTSMMLGVLESNRDNIRTALRNLREALTEIENALLETDTTKLIDLLEIAQNRHQNLVQ